MARDIFLYGTLRDPGQLEAVLGHDGSALRDDALPGADVLCDAAMGSFPVLVKANGGSAAGKVLTAGADDLARLDWYEAIFGYERAIVTLASGAKADVYWPRPTETSGRPWDLAEWLEEWGEAVEMAAREVMVQFPSVPPGEVGPRYPLALSRALSAMRARSAPSTSAIRRGAGRKGVTLARRIPRHRGFFALDELHIDHRRFDGGREQIMREVFIATDASLVLPYDPRRDEVVLVEQFRAGPFRRGDPHPWCLEPVAGLIDPGETAEDCARRETMEEADLTLSGLVPVPGGYPSPGATTEYYHLFIGLTDLSDYRPRSSGVAAEGEDIMTHVMTLGAALDLLNTAETQVLPLAYLLTWTAAHRERLAAASH